MSASGLLLPEIEGLAAADPEHRDAVLRRLAALLAASGITTADPRLAVFDDVLGRVVPVASARERAALAAALAAGACLPPRVGDLLARDDEPTVAAPLLAAASPLSEATLVAVAAGRGQEHLAALARRPTLAEPVTDVIVERGAVPVLVVVAENRGARFSEYGLTTLVGRAPESERLTLAVGKRDELPKHLHLRLLAHASEEVRARLAGNGPKALAGLALESGRIDYAEAMRAVERLARSGGLGEAAVSRFAGEGAVAHAIAAIAALARLPLATVESAVRQPRPEALLLVARALDFDWPTVRALLSLRPAGDDPVAAVAAYERLKPETARAALDLRRRG